MLYYYKVTRADGSNAPAVIASMFRDLAQGVVIRHLAWYVRVVSPAMSFDELRANPDLRALLFLH